MPLIEKLNPSMLLLKQNTCECFIYDERSPLAAGLSTWPAHYRCGQGLIIQLGLSRCTRRPRLSTMRYRYREEKHRDRAGCRLQCCIIGVNALWRHYHILGSTLVYSNFLTSLVHLCFINFVYLTARYRVPLHTYTTLCRHFLLP
jgi:hypothetical protein